MRDIHKCKITILDKKDNCLLVFCPISPKIHKQWVEFAFPEQLIVKEGETITMEKLK